MKKSILQSPILLLLIMFQILSFKMVGQNYGGEIKLKITYENKPLVGYTITGSINKIDIGGKGVTDSNGNVTLHTDPLPIPNIDVKGVINCGNTKREWEASGFVYVSPSNDNFYHLKLEEVAKQMSEFSGLGINMIMESFGLNCPGATGGGNTSSSSQNNSNAGKEIVGNQANNNDELQVDNNATKEKQKKFTDDVMSGQTAAQGYENQKNMLNNQIAKLDNKIAKKEDELTSDKLSTGDRNDLLYDVKEMQIEKAIKQNKLDKVNLIISKGNKPLNKSEKAPFKKKDEQLSNQLDSVKEDRKKRVSLVEGVPSDELSIYSEAEINNMSLLKLKSTKVELKSKLGKKKLSLKTKSKIMSQDKKTALEQEIEMLENTLDLVVAEIEARNAEK